MYFDPLRDPRYEPLQPTAEEIDGWASRERKRREAWLAGPTQDEQDDWVRRYRRRAALGFADSRLGPSREDVAQWAEREHKRRQAWLAGPTEQEKREWASRSRRRGLAGLPESELPPTEEEIKAWAEQERGRRQAWLEGPTEDEKQRWIRREAGGGEWEGLASTTAMETELLDAADRLLREADLAAKGSLVALARAPLAIWSYLMRSGRMSEEELYQPPSRRRVRF
jgi:hypothetical protein